jgi:outer membrane protein TolC
MKHSSFLSSSIRALTFVLALDIALATAGAQQADPNATHQREPNPAGAESSYPVDLPTVLRLAGAQNLDVQLARNAVDEAHANYDSAVERFLPALVPSASYLRHTGRDQAVDGNLVDVTKHSQTAGVAVSGQIPVGDAIFQALQTRQLVHAADAAEQAQEQDSGLVAAQQYFDLVNAGAIVDVVSQALSISTSYEQQLDEAVRIGIAFKGDAFRVQTQTQRLQVDLTRAKQQQRLASARLAQTLHLDPLLELAPADREPQPLALADLSASPKQLMQNALQNRPELARSGALIHAAEQARRGALYGPLIPTLGGQAFIGEFDGGPGDINANGGPRRDYSVGLSWRIGPGGLLDWGRIKATSVRVTTAEITDEKLRDEIERQVVEGYTRVQSLFEQMRVARLNLTAAEETLRLTRGRKQMGVGTVLEDIQAQQELLRSRSDLVNIVTELNQQQYALLRSVGTSLHKP